MPPADLRIVAGIDGCPTGWVWASKNLASGAVRAGLLARLSDLLRLDAPPGLALIDIPIGLPDAGTRGCDLAARRLLKGPRSRSVFPAPIRPMLAATDFAACCRVGLDADGRGLSLQAWGLLPKIRETDAFLRRDDRPLLREVHPEASFMMWNGGAAMTHRKKSAAGRAEREALVRTRYAEALDAARASLPRSRYAFDDLLDAFAALWSAERAAAGAALTLPNDPPRDACGLRMEIVV
jgi:predicted RNase H-like nuclease